MMETIDCQVVPEWGNPLGFFLLAREKGIRWHVSKVFEDERMMAYHYRFTHLGAKGNPVSPAAYAGHALNLGISRADNERAARWFLTQYFSFRELHYTFGSILGGAQGGYYPVLCRRFVPRSDFELSWES